MTDILYSCVPLDRGHLLRRDDKAQAAMLAGADKLILPYWRELSLVSELAAAARLDTTLAARVVDLADQTVFLGMDGGVPVFAADISCLPPEDDGSPPCLGLPGAWHLLRAVGGTLPAGDAAVLAYARAMLLWHRRARFCGHCGAPTESREGGHLRVCLDHRCGAQHYPRTDPAVIMRVDGDGGILLHRQPSWAPGMWSVLAGFVEPGETLEEAVAREVREESGIEVADVAYFGSQPWPFPSSLMMAFTARAVGGTLAHDPQELEDARWFSRDEILRDFDDSHRAAKDGRPFLSNRDSISRWLIDDWLRR